MTVRLKPGDLDFPSVQPQLEHDHSPACPACGGPLIQKNRTRLLGVGLLMILGSTLAWLVPILHIPAIILFLTGLYLLVWASLGRGRWCRNCKMFLPGG